MMNKSGSLSSQANLNPAMISGISKPPAPLTGPQESIDLDELAAGTIVEIETGHTTYRLQNVGDGKALISGHPEYCPQPLEVQIHGSLGDNGMLQWRHIGKGRKLVFLPPNHGVVRTSRIKGIRIVQPGRSN